MKSTLVSFLRICCGVILIAVVSCKSSDSEAKLLRFNLEKGKTYEYEIVWDLNQEIEGQKQTISVLGTYSLLINNRDAGVTAVTGTYTHFRLGVNAGGLDMEIDTDKPESAAVEGGQPDPVKMMSRVFSGIKGKSFTMQVKEDGEVLNVEGFDRIVNAMVDSTGVDEDAKAQMKLSLKDQFNEQAIKDQFASVFSIFPDKPVKIGDSWENSFVIGGRLPSKFNSTYKVDKIDGDKVTLAVNTLISSTDGTEGVKGKQTGTLLINSKSGLVLNAEFTQEIKASTDGITVNVTGKGKVKGRQL